MRKPSRRKPRMRARRPEIISREVRKRFYYSIPEAGRLVGLGRTQSYRAADLGQIPTEKHGKFLLVPRGVWDREVRRLLPAGQNTTAIPESVTA
jgi:hypothetical protein